MVIIRTIAAVTTAVFTIGIYDRLGPRKDGVDFVNSVAVAGKAVAAQIAANSSDPPRPPYSPPA